MALHLLWHFITQSAWNIKQDADIEHIDQKSTNAANTSNRFEYRICQLEEQASRSSLIINALWEILHSKLGITEKELSEIVTRLDMSDGKINGKKANKVEICSHCGCVISNTFKKCLICGEPAKGMSEVDTI